jgi:hypothetical protein
LRELRHSLAPVAGLELLFFPVTALKASRGNPDIRPGKLLESVPAVKPTTHSFEVDIVVVKGKESAIEAVIEHLSGPAEADGNTRAWMLVKRTRHRKATVTSRLRW